MKILVLAGSASEPSYQSITTYLSEIGVPFQGVVLSSITRDASGNRMSKVPLSDTTTGRGLYQGVIVTDSTFAACNPACLSTADWTTLNTYAAQFSVRVASYYTLPAAQWGLVAADAGVSYTASNPLNVTLTAAGSQVFPYLNAANAIPVYGSTASGIRAYLATTTAAANETTTPLLSSGIYTLAATHTTADGRETLALTMDNSTTALHSLAFHYGVINWVTKGVFLGSRKIYMSPEIDDMFMGSWQYAPTQQPQCANTGTCPTVYTTATDVHALANWQTSVQANPLFSNFHARLSFVGVASTYYAATDPLMVAVNQVRSQFGWISHSWDHPNLDCYSLSGNGACVPATLAQSLAEIDNNVNIAASLGLTNDALSMVTPFNSGLTNPNFLAAAVQRGIRYIADPSGPPSPGTGTVNAIAPSILQVPARANNLNDNVSSPLTGVYGSWPDEYNAQFGPKGTQPTYSQNQTYAQILDSESDAIFRKNLLSYEPDPLVFHIGNFSTYDGTHSLYSDLLDATIAKYTKVFALPVLTVDMKDAGALLANRASYNASGVVGVYTPGVSVVLTTTKAAAIPVTGACSQATCASYGGQIQDSVSMAANSTVTLSLTATQGVTPASVSLSPASVTGGASSTGTVTLSAAAPAGGAIVALSSDTSSATVPGSVTIAAGSTSANFTVSTTAVTASTTATITASYNSVSKTASLTITPTAAAAALSTVSVNPVSVTGGGTSAGTVTLSAAAPTGGAIVTLKSSSTSATVPASVTVAAGSTTATFTVSTTTVTASVTATITATYSTVSKTASLTITPAAAATSLSSVSLNPVSVIGGGTSTGTVTLSAAAPTGGAIVTLKSSSTSATVPASVTVAAGSTTATFTVSTTAVTATATATITATYSTVSKTASLSITVPAAATISSVSVSPASVSGGTSATGTVTMSTAAPAGGLVVYLWTTGTIAFVPDSITIPAGSTQATFTVVTLSGFGTLQDTITAFYNGATKTAPITVTP